MAVKKPKKSAAKKSTETNPMPGLIFEEGKIESLESPTPKADQIEKELHESGRPPSLKYLDSYNKQAGKLMWFAVICLTLVICAMWSWSVYFQFSAIDRSKKSEIGIIEATKKNWRDSFQDENGNPLSTDRQINDIKQNLVKLLAGAAVSSSSTTSTPEVTSTTP